MRFFALLCLVIAVSAHADDLPIFEGDFSFRGIQVNKIYKEIVFDSRYQLQEVKEHKEKGYLCALMPMQKYKCRKIVAANEIPFDAHAYLNPKHESDRIKFGTLRAQPELSHESPAYIEYTYKQKVRYNDKQVNEFLLRYLTLGPAKIEGSEFGFLFKNEKISKHAVRVKKWQKYRYKLIYEVLF